MYKCGKCGSMYAVGVVAKLVKTGWVRDMEGLLHEARRCLCQSAGAGLDGEVRVPRPDLGPDCVIHGGPVCGVVRVVSASIMVYRDSRGRAWSRGSRLWCYRLGVGGAATRDVIAAPEVARIEWWLANRVGGG